MTGRKIYDRPAFAAAAATAALRGIVDERCWRLADHWELLQRNLANETVINNASADKFYIPVGRISYVRLSVCLFAHSPDVVTPGACLDRSLASRFPRFRSSIYKSVLWCRIFIVPAPALFSLEPLLPLFADNNHACLLIDKEIEWWRTVYITENLQWFLIIRYIDISWLIQRGGGQSSVHRHPRHAEMSTGRADLRIGSGQVGWRILEIYFCLLLNLCFVIQTHSEYNLYSWLSG